MLKVEVNAKQPIERALKVLKRKFDKSRAIKILKEKKEYTKKSVRRRKELSKAKYVQKKWNSND